jgi:hypothetical protein
LETKLRLCSENYSAINSESSAINSESLAVAQQGPWQSWQKTLMQNTGKLADGLEPK